MLVLLSSHNTHGGLSDALISHVRKSRILRLWRLEQHHQDRSRKDGCDHVSHHLGRLEITTKRNLTVNEESWCHTPILDVAGQQAFWDDQADCYEGADMTNDNTGEMEVALEKCREVQPIREIVVLGGAVGCRDPKMILDSLYPSSHNNTSNLPKVFFNDLSRPLIKRAKEMVLRPWADRGVQIEYLHGEIRGVCQQVPRQPRRFILGVYDARSFFSASPNEGYPLCGFDEYLKNHAIIGEHLCMTWVALRDDCRLVPYGSKVCANSPEASATDLNVVKSDLEATYRMIEPNKSLRDVVAIQVIGRRREKPGFFLSHWYTTEGITRLVRLVFPHKLFSIDIVHSAKGIILTIDPHATTDHGIVTMLNNVLGNVLPHHQYATLCSVRERIS